jgi:dTMP kinase
MTTDTGAKRGIFITFEGGEGVGKSTQIKHLATRLTADGVATALTREPGGSPFAEHARALLLDPAKAPQSTTAQALLFYAARADHLDQTIRPALRAGRWVLCDRFADSTRAYQGAASGVDASTIATLDRIVVAADQPDMTILLDLDAKVGLARANQRRTVGQGAFVAADTYEGQRIDFHQRLRQGFLDLAAANPARFVIIDASQNELLVADRIWAHVSTRFASALPPRPAGV